MADRCCGRLQSSVLRTCHVTYHRQTVKCGKQCCCMVNILNECTAETTAAACLLGALSFQVSCVTMAGQSLASSACLEESGVPCSGHGLLGLSGWSSSCCTDLLRCQSMSACCIPIALLSPRSTHSLQKCPPHNGNLNQKRLGAVQTCFYIVDLFRYYGPQFESRSCCILLQACLILITKTIFALQSPVLHSPIGF